MGTVTISPKFQVVVPKEIRARLKLRPGQKVHAMVYEDRIELVAGAPGEKPAALVVPSVSLYEVFKRALQQRDHGAALQERHGTTTT